MFILRFLGRRLFQGAIIVFLVSALIFTLLRVVPGDPVLSFFWKIRNLRITDQYMLVL